MRRMPFCFASKKWDSSSGPGMALFRGGGAAVDSRRRTDVEDNKIRIIMTIEMYIWRVVEDHFQSSMRIHLGHKKHICIRRWRPVATMRCSRMRVLCSKSLPVLPSNWFSVLRWKKIPWDTLQGTGAPHNCFKEALAAASLWRGIAAAATTPWERRKAATTRNRVLNAEAPFRSTAKATATVPPIVGSGKGGGGKNKRKKETGPQTAPPRTNLEVAARHASFLAQTPRRTTARGPRGTRKFERGASHGRRRNGKFQSVPRLRRAASIGGRTLKFS